MGLHALPERFLLMVDISIRQCCFCGTPLAAGLLKWVLAMVNYFGVAKGVEPKRKKVADSEKALRIASKDLADTKARLAALNQQLEGLRSQFADKTSEQQVGILWCLSCFHAFFISWTFI